MTSVPFVGVTGAEARATSVGVGTAVLAGVEVPAAATGVVVAGLGGAASTFAGCSSGFSRVAAVGTVADVEAFGGSSSSKSEADRQPRASRNAAKPCRFRFFFGVVATGAVERGAV